MNDTKTVNKVVLKEKLYRANINLSALDYTPIMANMVFPKRVLHEKTFDNLVEQGHIEEALVGVPATPAVVDRAQGTMTVGLRNETPDAAMHPPKDTTTMGLLNILNPVTTALPGMHQPVVVPPAVAGQGNPDAAALPDTIPTADIAAETPTVIEGLNQTQVAERVKAACAWNIDPATLKGTSLIQVLDIYNRMCAKLEVEPKVFEASDDGRAKLVAFMTSEFKSK